MRANQSKQSQSSASNKVEEIYLPGNCPRTTAI